MKCVLLAISGLLLGGCAFHSGQFETSLPNEPVEHIDIAVGVATTTKVFGLGSVGKDALLREARQKMIANRPLFNDEAYNNYTIDYKRTYFILGTKTKVTISADVIVPKDTLSNPTFTTEYLNQMDNQYSYYDSLFWIGDSVIFNRDQYGEIVGFEGRSNKDVRIQYTEGDGDVRTTTRHGKDVYVLISHYRGKRARISRPLGNIIGYGVEGDIFLGKDGDHFYYAHGE